MLFGANFRKARLKAGISQSDVAEQAGMHQHYVSEIERGLQNPTLETMTMLADAIGAKVHLLLKPPPKRRANRR